MHGQIVMKDAIFQKFLSFVTVIFFKLPKIEGEQGLDVSVMKFLIGCAENNMPAEDYFRSGKCINNQSCRMRRQNYTTSTSTSFSSSTSQNQKKRLVEAEASPLIHASIHRSLVPLLSTFIKSHPPTLGIVTAVAAQGRLGVRQLSRQVKAVYLLHSFLLPFCTQASSLLFAGRE